MVGGPFEQEMIEQVPSFLFSFDSPELTTLKRNIDRIHAEVNIPLKEQFDAIVILDKGIIYNIKNENNPLMIEIGGTRRLGIVGALSGEKSLMDFLLYASVLNPHYVRMIPIVRQYIQTLAVGNYNFVV